jgi:DNA-binding transcriptional regulator GbsR (MarR family)
MKNLLSQDGFIMLNKTLITKVGLHEAIIIGSFFSQQKYHGEWFYFTYEEIEKQTTLGKSSAAKAIDNLIKLGILMDKREGLPRRRYFTILNDKVSEIFDSSDTKPISPSRTESERLEVHKTDDIIYNKNRSNKNRDKEEVNDKPEWCSDEEWIKINEWLDFRTTTYKLKKSPQATKVQVNKIKAFKDAGYSIDKAIEYVMTETTWQNVDISYIQKTRLNKHITGSSVDESWKKPLTQGEIPF